MQPIIIDVESIGIEDAATYIEPVTEAPDNYKKPESIAKYIAEANAKAIERAALDVDLARIICLGISRPGYPTEIVTTQHNTEGELLRRLWDLYDSYGRDTPTLVTFNGLGFDVPLLLRRSLYLSIPAPYINCDRFKHPWVIDTMAILSMDGKLKAHKLQFYLNRFGYPNGGPDITGADIAERYAAGDWAAIEQRCRMDVDATKWLAERIGAISKTAQPVAVAAGAF